MQKIILIGNLGAAPETKGEGDKAFYTAKLAVSTYNSKTKENETTWYSLVFGSFMEKRVAVMSKGMKLYIEGKLNAKTFVDKEEETRIDLSVYVSEVQILSKIEKSEDSDDEGEKKSSKKPAKKEETKGKKKANPFDDEEGPTDELPF